MPSKKETQYQVVITVATKEQAEQVVAQLGLAEEEGELDFPFNTEIHQREGDSPRLKGKS